LAARDRPADNAPYDSAGNGWTCVVSIAIATAVSVAGAVAISIARAIAIARAVAIATAIPVLGERWGGGEGGRNE